MCFAAIPALMAAGGAGAGAASGAALAATSMGSAASLAAATGGYLGATSSLLAPGLMASMGGLGTVMQAVGGMTSAYGQYASGKYSSAVARNNAIMAGYQERDALQRGQQKEAQHRLLVSSKIGEQRAQIGSSGFDVGAGSALDVIGDTAAMGEVDALTIRADAEREAWGHRAAASNYRAQSKMESRKGMMGAATSLIGSAGSVADKWYVQNRGF